MAHQIKDEKQEYQYTGGFTTPAGHEFHYYDTPKNERFVIKHSSGSHIEFKADGSIMIKSLKDLHMHSSIVSDATEQKNGGSDTTTQKIDTNYTLDVTGTLNIKCKKLNVEVGDTGRVYCGTDLITNCNNFINKSTESTTIEAAKSIYLDSDEFKHNCNIVIIDFLVRHGFISADHPAYTNIVAGMHPTLPALG